MKAATPQSRITHSCWPHTTRVRFGSSVSGIQDLSGRLFEGLSVSAWPSERKFSVDALSN